MGVVSLRPDFDRPNGFNKRYPDKSKGFFGKSEKDGTKSSSSFLKGGKGLRKNIAIVPEGYLGANGHKMEEMFVFISGN